LATTAVLVTQPIKNQLWNRKARE